MVMVVIIGEIFLEFKWSLFPRINPDLLDAGSTSFSQWNETAQHEMQKSGQLHANGRLSEVQGNSGYGSNWSRQKMTGSQMVADMSWILNSYFEILQYEPVGKIAIFVIITHGKRKIGLNYISIFLIN
jgi:hypothetical protein